jgi:hypothetical protein
VFFIQSIELILHFPNILIESHLVNLFSCLRHGAYY